MSRMPENKCSGCACDLLTLVCFGERLAESKRIADARDRCLWGAATGYDERTVIEDASQQALLNLNTLDLVQVDFDRAAADETEFCDNALIGDRQFRGNLAQVDAEQDEQSQPEYWQQQQANQNRAGFCPDAEFRAMNDLFVCRQDAVDIAGHFFPSSYSAQDVL